MKKNHALRGFVITGFIGFLLTGLLLVIGTLLAQDGIPSGAAWFQNFEGYYTIFQNLGDAKLWSISVANEQLISNIVWFALLGVFGIFLIVSFIVTCVKKKPRLLWGVLLNLIFSCGILYAFLGLYSAEFLNVSGGTVGKTYSSLVKLITFQNQDLANTWWHNAILIGLFVSLLILLIGIIGMFFAILSNTKKVEEVVEVSEETPVEVPAVEETPVEEPVVEKKKGILVLKRFDKFGETGPVVDRGTVDYPNQHVTAKPLTADEIREVIRDELKRQETEKLCEELKEKRNAEAIAEHVIRVQEQREAKLARNTQVKEDVTVVTTDKKSEEKTTPLPVIFAIPQAIKEEAVKGEHEEPVKKAEPKKKALTEEKIKEIVADEIKSALKDLLLVKETVVEKPVEVRKVVEKPVEEVKPVEVAPLVNEEPKAEATPIVEPVAPEASVEEAPEAEAKPKIIRIPFKTRMEEADDDLKSAYNELKSLLKSYGLNNRVANGGDSFRLHRVTYCKITVAGKSLKLYLALDPEDYKDSTYPIKDASSKAIYKETPLVFKVKSGLSLRRATELIRNCMDKHGLEQIDQIQVKDWVSELANEAVDEGEDEE